MTPEELKWLCKKALSDEKWLLTATSQGGPERGANEGHRLAATLATELLAAMKREERLREAGVAMRAVACCPQGADGIFAVWDAAIADM